MPWLETLVLVISVTVAFLATGVLMYAFLSEPTNRE